MSEVLTVHMWADITCPWSYLGLGRFAEGIRRYHERGGARPVAVEFHSFELSPDTPVDFDGSEVDFLVRHRGSDTEQATTMLREMARVAATEGVVLDFERVRHANSRLAHELVHLAAAHGKRDEMVVRLMSAYFAEGRHVGRVDDLVDLAADIGLSPVETLAALEGHTYADAVAADIESSAFFRIRALPFVLVGPRFGVSGPHEPSYYAEVLDKIASAPADQPAE